MKAFKATLKIINIKAKNKEHAKRKFWEQVMEDKPFLDVEIVRMYSTTKTPKKDVLRALEIIEEFDGWMLIVELREQYTSRYDDFQVRLIGALCAGDEPYCRLEQSGLRITKKGRKALGCDVNE